jgi:glycosyltransferase involved in cell wall biosynthesis
MKYREVMVPKGDKPLVTICCITYNHAPYIRDAIEGFLMQKTNFPFEIIIHDDASTDGTTEIVKEYADKYPNLIVPILQKENQYSKGVKILSNHLWKKVSGEYIASCEGDDYWTDPLKLQKQVDFLEKNPDYSVTYHDVKIVDDKGEILKESGLPKELKRNFSQDELIKTTLIYTCTKCYRYYKKGIMNIDDDFRINSFLGNYGKGKYLSTVRKSVYRQHPGGVWSSKSKFERKFIRIENTLKLYNLYIKLKKPRYIKYFRKQFNKHIYELMVMTDFLSEQKNIKDSIDILRDNYSILSFWNKLSYKLLTNKRKKYAILQKAGFFLFKITVGFYLIILRLLLLCKKKMLKFTKFRRSI